MTLKITKAKPNPLGRDRIGTFTPPIQLAGEWVDIQNTTAFSIALGTVQLYQWAYKPDGSGEWRLVISFSESLPAWKTMRIHSGSPLLTTQMNSVDVIGADYHLFTNKNYIWNNRKPDYPRLWDTASRQWIDWTYYDAPVPNGKILIRVNDKLT